MFERQELDRMIELHEKSYHLLTWINQSLKTNSLSFHHIHHAMSVSEAAEEWIRRHLNNIPLDTRPKEVDIPPFARLFASYLTTSFELREKPGKRLYTPGCHCPMCGYLAAADHLRTKKITPKAKQEARHLKRVYLQTLATASELPLLEKELDMLLDNPHIVEELSLATYINELIRRSQFASQGEGILVLWREIAWEGTAPKKHFRLSTTAILNAEDTILQHMQAF